MLYGRAGDDLIRGSTGNDRAWGGRGHDALFGDRSNNKLNGGPGNDEYLAGVTMTTWSDKGVDQLAGHAGDDVGRCSADFDIFDGGPGLDVEFSCEVVANVP